MPPPASTSTVLGGRPSTTLASTRIPSSGPSSSSAVMVGGALDGVASIESDPAPARVCAERPCDLSRLGRPFQVVHPLVVAAGFTVNRVFYPPETRPDVLEPPVAVHEGRVRLIA